MTSAFLKAKNAAGKDDEFEKFVSLYVKRERGSPAVLSDSGNYSSHFRGSECSCGGGQIYDCPAMPVKTYA
jgi:hypothetical protein